MQFLKFVHLYIEVKSVIHYTNTLNILYCMYFINVIKLFHNKFLIEIVSCVCYTNMISLRKFYIFPLSIHFLYIRYFAYESVEVRYSLGKKKKFNSSTYLFIALRARKYLALFYNDKFSRRNFLFLDIYSY